MSGSAAARRVAAAAALGGGGLGALAGVGAGTLYAVLVGQSKLARRRIPEAVDDPPVSHDTIWTAAGVSRNRPPVRLAVLGDSTAAGYGVARDRDTPAARLAVGISESARRPVHVSNVAVVGAQSSALAAQLDTLGRAELDLAVILIGANDVTHRVRRGEAVGHLEAAVRALRDRGVEVVVATCPDLGTIRPLSQPLRAYARRLSRKLAAAQTVAVVRAGGRTVSLGDLLGELFSRQRDMFSDDLFHPSAAGYREAAEAILPSCLDALGLRTRARSASAFTTRRSKSLTRAAAQAAARPGAEVAPPLHGRRRRFGLRPGMPRAVLRRRWIPRRGTASPELAQRQPAAPPTPARGTIRTGPPASPAASPAASSAAPATGSDS